MFLLRISDGRQVGTRRVWGELAAVLIQRVAQLKKLDISLDNIIIMIIVENSVKLPSIIKKTSPGNPEIRLGTIILTL